MAPLNRLPFLGRAVRRPRRATAASTPLPGRRERRCRPVRYRSSYRWRAPEPAGRPLARKGHPPRPMPLRPLPATTAFSGSSCPIFAPKLSDEGHLSHVRAQVVQTAHHLASSLAFTESAAIIARNGYAKLTIVARWFGGKTQTRSSRLSNELPKRDSYSRSA